MRNVRGEQLRANRVKHNRLIMLETFRNRFVVEHTDSDGIVHYFVCSMISGDGLATSNATTTMSLARKGIALYLRCDQLSCARCQRTMTLLVDEDKKPEDITEDDLEHQGQCFRNTKWSPAVAGQRKMPWKSSVDLSSSIQALVNSGPTTRQY